MNRTQDYSSRFYENIHRTALASAEHIVPIVMDMVHAESVIDVGCGSGTWLSVFRKCGVRSVFGIDSQYVEAERLCVKQGEFEKKDLSRPFELTGVYDLAVCLEVAEHLPKKMAAQLVAQLTKVAPVVMFSAAVPGQGGTSHINEQWHEYWHEHFQRFKYQHFDIIRPVVFANSEVAWWYRQNLFVYIHEDSELANEFVNVCPHQTMEVIAPHILARQTCLSRLLASLPSAIRRSIENSFGR